MILSVLFFNKIFVFADDLIEQLNPDRAPEKIGGVVKETVKDVARDVADKAKEKLEETTGIGNSPQEKAAEKGKELDKTTAEKVKSMGEIDLKNCDEENNTCCSIEIESSEILDTGNETLKAISEETKTENVKIKLCGGENLYAVTDEKTKQCKCIKEDISLGKLCERISNAGEQAVCKSCSERGVWTALGCIDFTLGDFVKNTLLGWGIGLAGVVSLLCIIYSAFMMQISGGNPEKLKKTRERLNSCIIGLILIIFSVFILKVIGVDILRIPGFNK